MLQMQSANLKAVLVVASLLCAMCLLTPASASYGKTEDEGELCSRSSSHFSCIMGCYKCAELYGRKVYNMGSCCKECARSGAVMVDNGPEFCSRRFLPEVSIKNYLAHRKRSANEDDI